MQTERQGDIKFDIEWTTLGRVSGLAGRAAASRRTSRRSSAPPRCACTRSATPIARRRAEELERMRALVRKRDGGGRDRRRLLAHLRARRSTRRPTSSSSWPKVASESGGMYISHMRSEGNRLLEAIDELMTIAREAQHPRRDLPPQGRGRVELGQAGRRDRQGRGRAEGRPRDHRRHVHLHGGLDRARRGDAAVGAGRRLRGLG